MALTYISNSGLILQKRSTEPGEIFEQDRLTAHRISELQLGHTDCVPFGLLNGGE
jgi:hypothetical protein